MAGKIEGGYANVLITSEQVPVRFYGSAGRVSDQPPGGGTPFFRLTGKFWIVVGTLVFSLSTVRSVSIPNANQAFLKLRGRFQGRDGELSVNMLTGVDKSLFLLFQPGTFDSNGVFAPDESATPFAASAEAGDFDQAFEYLRIVDDIPDSEITPA
jgi:hypothetical protein